MPYIIQRWTEPIPSEDNKCYVCLRKFGVADEDEDDNRWFFQKWLSPAHVEPVCDALRANCGHYIGTECFLKLIHTDLPMVCSLCQEPYPRAKPSFVRKLAILLQWFLFTLEVEYFQLVTWLAGDEDDYPIREGRYEQLSYQLIRGDIKFDFALAEDVLNIGGTSVATILMVVMPLILSFQGCIHLLKQLPPGSYAEVWTSFGFFGYELAGKRWLYDMVPSILIASEALEMALLIPTPEEDPPFVAFRPIQYGVEKLQILLDAILTFVATVAIARVVHLLLSLSKYTLMVLYVAVWVMALQIALHRILCSRNFYKL